MMEVKWIKISTDIFDNRKIRQIENMEERDSILTIWFKILCLAGKINNGGKLLLTDGVPYDLKMLATEFQRPAEQVEKALDIFFFYKMMDNVKGVYHVVNWYKYQSLDKMEKIRDQNRTRKAKQREKDKGETTAQNQQTCDIEKDVTQCHATDKDIDKDKEIDKEKDKKEKCLSVFDQKQSAQSLQEETTGAELENSQFEEFYKLYPRHQEKTRARIAYRDALLLTDHAVIMEACRKYRAYHKANSTSTRFIKYAVTWLKNGCWEDELPEPEKPGAKEDKREVKKCPRSPYNSIYQALP